MTYSQIIRILLIVPTLLVVSYLVYHYQDTRALTGIVRDAETQTPVADVAISVAGYGATSNANGEYAVPISRGTFLLTAKADGYLPAQMPVNGTELFTRTFAVNVTLIPQRV